MAVDHVHNRHETKTAVECLDLSLDASWDFLRNFKNNNKVLAWHFGLPCGTCSRAREIQLSAESWGPPPLRSEEFLLGNPWNSPKDKEKVGAANVLYEKACEFIMELIREGHIVTIENPTGSWLWMLPYLQPILRHCFFADLHTCMFGALRKKKTSFLVNHGCFQLLSRFCNGLHEHLPWGLDQSGNFATASEAAYPIDLCVIYCDALVQIMQQQEPVAIRTAVQETQETLEPHHNLLQTEQRKQTEVEADVEHARPFYQPRGRKLPQLIPEFKEVITIPLKKVPPLSNKKLTMTPFDAIPVGAKLLRTEAKAGNMTLCVFGVFHSKQQFVEVARCLQHPFDEFVNLPDLLIRCVFEQLTLGHIETARQRLVMLKKMRDWRQELKDDEARLHDKIPRHMQRLVVDKQFLLLRRLAEEIGWPDKQLHNELVQGFRLTGKGTTSNVFRPEVKEAKLTEEELMQQSKFLRPKIVGRVSNSAAPEYLEELREITIREADEKGWLQGPLTAEQVEREVGKSWLPVNRFAVRQKDKLRPIDNFCENRVNEAWECPERIDLHALDQMAWTLSLFYKVFASRGYVDVKLKDGTILSGKVHDDWTMANKKCVVTTVDLKDAYKQLGVSALDRDKAVVVLKSQHGDGVDHFLVNTLPFGATSSVHNFNRFSRMLWACGVVLMRIPWTNYFDDYPTVSTESLALSTLASAKAFLRLVGVNFAANKLKPMSSQAEVLGLVVDTGRMGEGVFSYAVKESRRCDLMETLKEVLEAGQVVPADLPSMLGRVQFADGQLAGRAGRLAMADIRQLGLNDKSPVKLDRDAKAAFETLLERFSDNRPKTFNLCHGGRPYLIFTDGSYEFEDGCEKALIGGVLITPLGEVRVFGSHVPAELTKQWKDAGKEHLIGQVELYAVCVARYLWKDVVAGKRTIFFIDNWAVLDCVIPGTSKEPTWRQLLLCIEKVDIQYPCDMWATRVPSESNVADPPSRGSLVEIQFLGNVKIDDALCPVSGEKLLRCV